MAARFLVSFVVIFSLAYFGQATRFLPMIVWDHINPMFKCKCNWLTDIPKIDEYDRVDFMCPSPKVAVKLLDGYSRPSSEMNENIFRRKWEGNSLTDLGKALDDDSFCDPKNTSTKNLYSCKDGLEGKSLGVTFKESNGYKTGDIFVFFNNGDDGKASTLSSQASKCSMVLVINITWSAKVKHDISYGKHLNPNGHTCDCLDCQCDNVNPLLSTPYPTTLNISTSTRPATSTATRPATRPATGPATEPATEPATGPAIEPKFKNDGNAVPGTKETRVGSNEKWDVGTFFIGFLAGIAILGFVVFVCWLYIWKKPQQSKGCMPMQSVLTVQNNTSTGPGFPNNVFQTSTLPRQDVNETIDVGTPLDCPNGQSTGYSNKAFQLSTPTVEVKDPIGVITPVDYPDGQSRQEKTG